MPFYKRFEELCKESNISPQSKEMMRITGISSPAISNWKLKGSIPKGDVLCRLSTYFNVSVDYLLGLTNVRSREAPPEPGDSLTEQEALLLDTFRHVDAEGQFEIIYTCMHVKKKADSRVISDEIQLEIDKA